MGGLRGEGRGEQSKSLMLLDSVRKTLFAKQQNKINIRKDVKNMQFSTFSPKQVLKFRRKSSNSCKKNERSGHHKLIKSINKAGKQVINTRQGFS